MKSIFTKLKKTTTVILMLAVFSASIAGCGETAQTSDVAANVESTEQAEAQESSSASESSTEDTTKEAAAEDKEAASEAETTEKASEAVSEAASAQETVLSEGTKTEAAATEATKTEAAAEVKEEVKEADNSAQAESDESYILLADGTKLYDGQSINASQIAGAKFILQGVPQATYWATAFLVMGPYNADEDPEPDWAYDQEVQAGGVISLEWPASTVAEFTEGDHLYVGISTKDYSFDKEWNFVVVR